MSRFLTMVALTFIVATGAAAQECTIKPNEMIGLKDDKGTCHGYSKEFAKKWLHVELSECEPPPQKGRLIAGECIVERLKPVQLDQDASDKRLLIVIEQMQGEIKQLRDEMSAQYHELMSEIDSLKATLSRTAK